MEEKKETEKGEVKVITDDNNNDTST